MKSRGTRSCVPITAGTLAGTVFDAEILDKKLTAEQHLRLDAVIAAVWVLLMAICFGGGLLRLAAGMDLI